MQDWIRRSTCEFIYWGKLYYLRFPSLVASTLEMNWELSKISCRWNLFLVGTIKYQTVTYTTSFLKFSCFFCLFSGFLSCYLINSALWFCRLKIFVPIAMLAWAILVPVNWTNNTLTSAPRLQYSNMDELSISNIPQGSSRFGASFKFPPVLLYNGSFEVKWIFDASCTKHGVLGHFLIFL